MSTAVQLQQRLSLSQPNNTGLKLRFQLIAFHWEARRKEERKVWTWERYHKKHLWCWWSLNNWLRRRKYQFGIGKPNIQARYLWGRDWGWFSKVFLLRARSLSTCYSGPGWHLCPLPIQESSPLSCFVSIWGVNCGGGRFYPPVGTYPHLLCPPPPWPASWVPSPKSP